MGAGTSTSSGRPAPGAEPGDIRPLPLVLETLAGSGGHRSIGRQPLLFYPKPGNARKRRGFCGLIEQPYREQSRSWYVWIVLDLLAVCLDLCTLLIEEGIADVHSGAGMNRGSFAECGMKDESDFIPNSEFRIRRIPHSFRAVTTQHGRGGLPTLRADPTRGVPPARLAGSAPSLGSVNRWGPPSMPRADLGTALPTRQEPTSYKMLRLPGVFQSLARHVFVAN